MKTISLEDLYNHLQIPQSAIAEFSKMQELNMQEIKELFHQNEDAFFEYLDEKLNNKYLEILYIYLNLAIDLYERYVGYAIDLKIFYDTIDDIRIWANNCLKETGEYGLKEIYWINEHLRMRIFKLGRLQFQKRSAEDFVELIKENNLSQYIKKDYFYFVHIPEGERLSYDLVLDSYQKAIEFYQDEMVFACESWMLSDRLDLIFNENSNVLKFRSDFILLSQERKENHIKRYLKPDSELLRKVKALEDKGVMIGEGFGICLNYISKA